jgi:hypothetical protein
VLGKIVRSCAREPSFKEASDALEELAEVAISSRQAGRIAHEVGQQLQADRDQRVEQFQAQMLKPQVETRPALAIIGVDGGRLQVRREGDGPGAHAGTWREDKIAVFATAAITTFESDPEPDLPDCFRSPTYVEKLVCGMSRQSSIRLHDPEAESPADGPLAIALEEGDAREKPKLLVRTYVASTCCSDEFGPMVAAEAHRRNLVNACQRVFVGDGAAWIWTLHQRYFPTSHAVLDFLHALGHLFAAAKAVAAEADECWALFQAWAEACWKGQVGQVIEQLRNLREGLGKVTEDEIKGFADDDPRRIIAQEFGYLERNQERMDYPLYRQRGLPWTSSHVESTVKLFNRRVKGTEKFWSETGGETILQLRAAFLSEDDGLDRHLKNRPCSPFRTYKTRGNSEAA